MTVSGSKFLFQDQPSVDDEEGRHPDEEAEAEAGQGLGGARRQAQGASPAGNFAFSHTS